MCSGMILPVDAKSASRYNDAEEVVYDADHARYEKTVYELPTLSRTKACGS